MELDQDNRCFCCGKANDRGLALAIDYPEAGSAEARFVVPEHFSGWQGMTHGGLLSMVLDELMAHACISAGTRAVTAEITVRFLQPLAVGTEVRVLAKVGEQRGRMIETRGWVYNPQGAAVAQGSAKFVSRGAVTSPAPAPTPAPTQ